MLPGLAGRCVVWGFLSGSRLLPIIYNTKAAPSQQGVTMCPQLTPIIPIYTTVRVYRQSARVQAADSATADPADSLPPHCSQLYIRPDPEREFPFSDFSDFNTNSLCSINRFYSSPDLLVSPVEIHTLARICVSVVQGFLVSVGCYRR